MMLQDLLETKGDLFLRPRQAATNKKQLGFHKSKKMLFDTFSLVLFGQSKNITFQSCFLLSCLFLFLICCSLMPLVQ